MDDEPIREIDDQQMHDSVAIAVAKLIALIVVTFALAIGFVRVLLPIVWEIPNIGPPLAVLTFAIGIVGLVLIYIAGRKFLLDPKKPKPKREKK